MIRLAHMVWNLVDIICMFQPKSNQQWQCIELESEHTDNVLHSVKTGGDHLLIHSHRLLADLEIAPVHQSRQGDAMVDAGEKSG